MIRGQDKFRAAATGAKRLAGTIDALTAKHSTQIPDLIATLSGRQKARVLMAEMQYLADAAGRLAKSAEACRAQFIKYLPEFEA